MYVPQSVNKGIQPDGGLMLVQRRRRWTNTNPASGPHSVCSVIPKQGVQLLSIQAAVITREIQTNWATSLTYRYN